MSKFANFARLGLLSLCVNAATASGVLADSYQVLHSFSGTDGASPSGLIQGQEGAFYGVATHGGDTSACAPDGCGAVFKSDTPGNVVLLHTFHATDGYQPTGLVEADHGKFYGTTQRGGQPSGGGAGTIFRVTATGKFVTLYAFTGGLGCCDGASPVAHPILLGDGILYGTTEAGGDFRDIDHQRGFGTVYRFDPKAKVLTILHSFNIADANGVFPNGPLLDGKDGFLYGTTREHGAAGGGTMFKIDTAGNFSLVTQLAGTQPLAGVIRGSHGDLYGTDEGNSGGGSAFRVSVNGQLTFINRFDGSDGYRRNFPMLRASDGFYYGATSEGGLFDFQGGAAFRMSAKGDMRTLHSFATTGSGGFFPNGALIQGPDGALYGTTGIGGDGGHGTLFRLNQVDLGEVASISADPAVVIAGQSTTGTVKLFNPAPAGGTVVTLGAQQGQIVIPKSVKVHAGHKTASFNIDTMNIGAAAIVRIYASTNGQGTRTTITVTP